MGRAKTHARGITAVLLEAGVVSREQIDAGLIRQRSTGLRIGETLVEMGAATEEDIGWALARQLDLPYVDLRLEALDRDLIQSFPEGLLHRLDAVPLLSEDGMLSVALADPTDSDILGQLERAAEKPLRPAVATPSAIRRVLRDVLGPGRELPGALAEPAPITQFDVQWDRSGASFLLFHLSEARRAGATEIHFLARSAALEVHYRVGGRLVRGPDEPPAAVTYLLARIEALGGPVTDGRSVHLAGRVVCPVDPDEIELGVSLLHQKEGLSVTLELRPSPLSSSSLEQLGLDPVDLARLREALDGTGGLGIVTGPPRAGGTTTLACLLDAAGMAGRRCITFGSAAARVLNEVHVPGPAAAAAGVWAEVAVGQCTDVVMLDGVLVGEAVSAALSPEAAGRLLLVRTDWTDTFALLEYLGSRSRARAALAARLRFVVQQRLVRLAEAPGPSAAPGLPRDRRAVFEVLVADDLLRDALLAGESAVQLRARAEAVGFRSLAARLQAMVDEGSVSAAEAVRNLG